MSIELLEKEIRRFLASADAEVLCISGKWGVGKTFAWNKYLQEADRDGAIGLKRYSYVSLFGRNSLDDVRSAIFENTVPLAGAPTKPNLASLVKSAEAGGRQLTAYARLTPKVKDYVALSERVLFATMGSQLICIDDLERAGKGLAVHDVLGLVSELKEQKACKVIVLLNAEKIPGDGKEAFEAQLEKVADISLTFNPSPSEAAEIGFSPGIALRDRLVRHCVTLSIVNIRVIKKIERHAKRLGEILLGYDRRILEQSVSSMALYTFSKFQPDSAPSLEFLQRFNQFAGLGGQSAEEYTKWRDLLIEYEYSSTDEFDLKVMAGVELGFFDEAKLRASADDLAASLKFSDQGNSVHEAWAKYHDSFDDNADAVLDGLDAAFRANANAITPLNASGTIRLFKELGREEQAKALAQQYVDIRNEPVEFWDLSEYAFKGDVTDPDLIAAFAEKHASFAPPALDAGDVLIRISRQSGWNTRDVEFLANLTAQDFVTLFKKLKGDDLRRAVREALRFVNRGSPESREVMIATRAKEALELIAAESPINARRVAQRLAEANGG
ncbi:MULTISPECIES: hypothetical protein [Brevundimonas]|jgi:hypothetical protein|uniref:KAP NTPase domain-containing protein n=1 Tax=Brevundimonas mediterranea TaxID=74329 RepID=A0AB37EA73_9CAUL|nr:MULTISPECIES: hypothetical protein [Brevundimonas]QIH74406.1 hypothetical protein GYM46_16510 [Brevundimonas mediterranea]TAJ50448.1 MAG: hypothetical protein EPO54_04420 [Brevundimonas sp.]